MGENFSSKNIELICKHFGEKFSKGYYFVANNIKFKVYGFDKIKRRKVIEGDEKVFDEVFLKGEYLFGEIKFQGNWQSVIQEYYNIMKREY
jgi:hypothetical protein